MAPAFPVSGEKMPTEYNRLIEIQNIRGREIKYQSPLISHVMKQQNSVINYEQITPLYVTTTWAICETSALEQKHQDSVCSVQQQPNTVWLASLIHSVSTAAR